MFLGCSKISVSVIVKHVQNIGIIMAFCLPEGNCYVFQCLGGTENIAGLWLARGDRYPA